MTVAEKESFTVAAKSLGITQSAVSQNVAEIEKNVGKPLFIRAKGSVTLTASGFTFKEYASRILHWYSAAESIFSNSDNQNSHLTICTDDLLESCVLPDVVASLVAVHSGLSVSLVKGNSDNSDLRIWTVLKPSIMTLEDSVTFIGSVPAVAVSSDFRLQGSNSLPDNVKLATLKTYKERLETDQVAKLVFESDSADSICRCVEKSPEIVGIVPLAVVPEGLCKLNLSLDKFRIDVHMNASEQFSENPLCDSFKNLIENKLMY